MQKRHFSVFFQTFYHYFCFNSHQAYNIYRLCHTLHICNKLCNFIDIYARFLSNFTKLWTKETWWCQILIKEEHAKYTTIHTKLCQYIKRNEMRLCIGTTWNKYCTNMAKFGSAVLFAWSSNIVWSQNLKEVLVLMAIKFILPDELGCICSFVCVLLIQALDNS